MNPPNFRHFLPLFALVMVTHMSNAASIDFDSLNWRVDVKKHNLTMYIADVPGSDVKAFKGESTYKATMPQLVSLLSDMKALPNILHGVIKSKSIKMDQANHVQHCWYEMDLPWPYKNRDFSIEETVSRTGPDSVLVTLIAKPDRVPPTKDRVRVKDMTVHIRLKKTSPKLVEMSYMGHVDPSGSLPSWLINMMLTDTPTKTLKNIHKADLTRYDENQAALLAPAEAATAE